MGSGQRHSHIALNQRNGPGHVDGGHDGKGLSQPGWVCTPSGSGGDGGGQGGRCCGSCSCMLLGVAFFNKARDVHQGRLSLCGARDAVNLSTSFDICRYNTGACKKKYRVLSPIIIQSFVPVTLSQTDLSTQHS